MAGRPLPRRVLRGLRRIFSSENNSEVRGLRLLRNWLTPEQHAQFDAKRYFDVIGCDSGKRYRIYLPWLVPWSTGTPCRQPRCGAESRPAGVPEPLIAGSTGSALRAVRPPKENPRSTEQWKDVPRGTMDEVSSHVRLVLPFD